MSQNFKPNGQNLRLVVVAAFAVIAIATTFAAASETPPESVAVDATSTNVESAESSTDGTTSIPITTLVEAPATLSSTTAPSGERVDMTDDEGVGTDFGATVIAVDATSEVLAELENPEPVAVDSFAVDGAATCAPIEATPAVDDAFFADGFDTSADAWDALSGSWSVVDGSYQQSDPAGYDLISQLPVDPPEQFRISVTVRALSEDLGGGLVLAQPLPAERAGATVVDFTDGGSFLRWGRYDIGSGQYVYLGGVSLGERFDPSVPHELAVEVRAERTMVLVDGVDVGTFEALGFGRTGLVTSRSVVAFDDLRIVEVGA